MSLQNQSRHRQRSFRLEAVVLRHYDWGEADRLLWLFSLEMGKIKAIAKGVRKPHSRKAGHLEPFTRVSLLLARGRDLFLITQAETLDAYLSLREGLIGVTYASYVVELLDRFTYEEGENRTLYRLLVDTLTRLSQAKNIELVLRYYEVRLMDIVGFRPQLFQCTGCGTEISPQDQYFSARQGGVLCPICGVNLKGSIPVSMESLKYLRHFQRSNYPNAMRARITPTINQEIEAIMQYYMTYLLERGLNTPVFLRQVRKDMREK
jgi:DNA repair protein RecO (recombination protein O)